MYTFNLARNCLLYKTFYFLTLPTSSYSVASQGNGQFMKGIQGDGAFQVGNTKVFIRKPQAYFALEKLRTLKLPMVATCIQKAIRNFQFRCKLYKMVDLHGVIKKAHSKVENNVTLRAVKRGPDLRLETDPLFKEWESLEAKFLKPRSNSSEMLYTAQKSLAVSLCAATLKAKLQRIRFQKKRNAAVIFQASWKGLSHRKNMDKALWNKCHNAMLGVRAELEKFKGVKRRRRASFDRVEKGIYIDDFMSLKGVGKLLVKNNQPNVLFAANVMKINKRWKEQPRTVMITDDFFFNLDPKTAKEKRRLAITDITSVSLSTLADDFFIIHCTDYDYIMMCLQKLEIVKILTKRLWYLKQQELKINFGDNLEAKNKSNKVQKFEFKRSAERIGTTHVLDKVEKQLMHVDVFDNSSHEESLGE
jgi:hypothetical protein